MKTLVTMMMVAILTISATSPGLLAAEKIMQVADVFTTTPKAIRGNSNNEAVADKFSQEKWNKWLEENIVGKTVNTGPELASGIYKNASDDFCMRLAIDCKSVGEGTPTNGDNDMHGITVICVFDKSLRPLLAKIEAGATVQVTGKIEKLNRFTYSIGPRTEAGHDMVMVGCSVKVIKPASKK